MSEYFLDRLARELPNLSREMRSIGMTAHDLDKEVENITGKDCDEVAKKASTKEFEKLAKRALENMKKNRKVMTIAA